MLSSYRSLPESDVGFPKEVLIGSQTLMRKEISMDFN